MKASFKILKADKIIKWGTWASIGLLVFEVLYIAIFYFSLPPFIPIFNQMPWGENRLGIKIEIFIPVVMTASFLILNFFLLGRLYEKMPLISRILSVTTLLITILSCIFVIRTLHLIV